MCQRFIPFMALFVFLPMTIAGAADLPPVLYYEITDLEILVTEPNISDPEDYYPGGSAYGVNKWGEAAGYSSAGKVQPDPFFIPTEVHHPTLWLPESRYGLPAGANDLSPDLFLKAQARDISDSGSSPATSLNTWERPQAGARMRASSGTQSPV